ncbi:glycosyltransferase family 31 protein [Schizophyllum amplum]|uniref:Glycosyltransferase family 31 protein n=1 Tax=Schizophyllum amplum TaxID=97359 RepID=A0A550C5X9_9AGAR|nr:glycosyltransferase family 31 protein [Auriculariopsis ampla]
MSFSINLLSASPLDSSNLDGYDSPDTDNADTTSETKHALLRHIERRPFLAPDATPSPPTQFLTPSSISGRCSNYSSNAGTPVPSRSTSPLPQFYASNAGATTSSCTSDTDSEHSSLMLRERNPNWRDESRRRWWSVSRRRRKRDGIFLRTSKKWTRWIYRHPLFPNQPLTIILALILLSAFAIFLTLLLMYILNPDKEPLPWRAYCSVPPPQYFPSDTSSSHLPLGQGYSFPPDNLDDIPPVGLFIGVFSVDSAFERRMLVRTTWASHPSSRDGAGEGDGGDGTSRTVVRFILGQPRKDWEQQIRLEMETYNDIVLLPMAENMNSGKSHVFFSWAAINAWVPPAYRDNYSISQPSFSYSNYTAPPPPFAPHDSIQTRQDQSEMTGHFRPWVRPDFVVKADDDAFVMLAELESRLRVELHAKPVDEHADDPPLSSSSPSFESVTSTSSNLSTSTTLSKRDLNLAHRTSANWRAFKSQPQDPLIYWGYFVKNRLHQFMAGELYALTWPLVDWVAKDPTVKTMTRGAEDKQTAKWMKSHPQADKIRWASERCYMYDHPRAGTVYGHGFLFPSEVSRVKQSIMDFPEKTPQDVLDAPTLATGGNQLATPPSWAHSSVSTFGVRYGPPVPNLTAEQAVEAMVEGSEMSTLREGDPKTPEYAWMHREGRNKRFEGNRVGGTVVVHYIKKHMWFLETAIALLEGDEYSDMEKFEADKQGGATGWSSVHQRRLR